ncbi:hypothetical protein [Ralstonia solanacearum]|uniref:hypothetical protein n=1 Tax=Ralstonia solanacearum TaxID=305 RepID=UPI0001D9522C|nr:hypothetical protein [Ralstonia solanacearum]CBJ43104.1 conserved protein of unknown function [Ralstonia solanacearum CFBP2957]
MRDVTYNVTGELVGLEQKRGRGRPRTGHAKSNAERQAAYRARRQAERAADRSVTVTKKLANVDAYDECRLEVEQLRVELLAKQEQVGMLIDYQEELAAELVGVRRQVEMAEAERSKAFAENRRLKEQLADAQKSVTPSNDNPLDFAFALLLIKLARKRGLEARKVFLDTPEWDQFVRRSTREQADAVAVAVVADADWARGYLGA